MKTLTFVKGTMILTLFFASILLFTSCGEDQKLVEKEDVVTEESTEAELENRIQESDAQFLVEAAEINLEEIQLGQLAQQKGTASHVRELGKMMVDTHTKSQSELTALAQRKMVTIPSSPSDKAQGAYNTLNEKTGNDFDKAYADRMVKDHKDAISTYEKASTGSNDTEIKNWATASLPGLRTYHDHSVESKKKFDKM